MYLSAGRSEKSGNIKENRGSRARARWLTVAERRIKSATRGGADVDQ
jgi:hypothetical protein